MFFSGVNMKVPIPALGMEKVIVLPEEKGTFYNKIVSHATWIRINVVELSALFILCLFLFSNLLDEKIFKKCKLICSYAAIMLYKTAKTAKSTQGVH